MRFWLCVVAVVLVLAGCAHKVTEQDMLGNWVHDPADARVSEKAVSLSFTADHKFTVTDGKSMIDGTWTFDEDGKRASLTPINLTIDLPQGKKTIRFMQIIQTLQADDANAKNADMIRNLVQEQRLRYYVISDDGKKLSENDRPAFIREGTKS